MGTSASESGSAIRRFTTEYVVAEDRIRISLEREDDSVALLWITRRLCIRLVPEIVKIVNALPKLQGKAETVSDNAQRKSQLDALGGLAQQPAVSAPKDTDVPTEIHLITGMQVQLTRKAILIHFKVEEAIVQTMPFVEAPLRQWLGILHACFRKGQWADDVWPVWITSKGWDQGPDALRLN